MILAMSRVRILGPRERLAELLDVLQDLGVLHLTNVAQQPHLQQLTLDPRHARRRRQLRAALEDVEATRSALGGEAVPGVSPRAASTADFARWRRLAHRLRRTVEELKRRGAALEEERALIEKYRYHFRRFEPLVRSAARWPNATAYHLVLRTREAGTLERLRASLAAVIGEAFELRGQRLPTGELAILLLVTTAAAARVEKVLADARVQEIPMPASYGGGSLVEAIPQMLDRLEVIPEEIAAIRSELAGLREKHSAELEAARAAIDDRLRYLEALPYSSVTAHAFVVEGWLPAQVRNDLGRALAARFDGTVVVEFLSNERWAAGEAPVVLSNPRLFRPFEVLIRLLPLPRYGNIDPTPFVAVFFPMFFGLILGDVGYGGLLAALGLALHARSRPQTVLRDIAEISGPCAVFSILFGFAYGEFLGDLGRRWFGMRALLFDREESVVPFLLLAIAIGLVHVLLGLGLGIVTSLREHPRQAAGRGLAAGMIVMIVLALLASFGILPPAFFTPSVIALLVAFPLLVGIEGLLAPIEFLSMLGHILSYARIMAIGTASVMLAVVANQMAGAIGSAIVGAVFALLFHLVNFALGLFSPTIHALRLHYVEFFGKFYSPGGTPYRPFGHWKSALNHSAQEAENGCRSRVGHVERRASRGSSGAGDGLGTVAHRFRGFGEPCGEA